ncbi:Transcription factor IIA alpha/beta subunit [Penicillium argentinense]|uniref:Transcription factor IIA alpha/beta subunit n=1 Tax=Penicillium argentinense TaxID=1131581 RepID=A0A9W9EWT6_9EURO|nr:Transcription factor IIA alpha/beta subunit [Penicillium argentinense]KAJ5089334.1 Transcription factor IIA alpha/beta subunit [Penicillium argentinense]
MSNQQVGTVFEKVIQEVCDSSQVDFEESGVDQKTLLDLREVNYLPFVVPSVYLDGLGRRGPEWAAKSGEPRSVREATWQQKLSSVNVAHFPWDPAPQPTPQAPVLPPQATVPSNAPRPPPQQHVQQQHVPTPVSLPQAPPASAPIPQAAAAMAGPRIKTEPGTNGQGATPNLTNPMAPNVPPLHSASARERAMNNVLHKYGPAAAQTVSQLQQPGQTYQQQMHASNGQMPQIKQEPGYPPMGPGQTDGADDSLSDWKTEVARRRQAAQNGEGDRTLKAHLKQQMLDLEAGGLLQPSTGYSTSIMSRAALTNSFGQDDVDDPSSSAPRMPGQTDGTDDLKVEPKEEADEDAINSDLDDPDDLVAEDHDADEMEGQVMLCTYDKVQRVKNKWKCTLKDGILTTGGKEYVFHKGQGEFEW